MAMLDPGCPAPGSKLVTQGLSVDCTVLTLASPSMALGTPSMPTVTQLSYGRSGYTANKIPLMPLGVAAPRVALKNSVVVLTYVGFVRSPETEDIKSSSLFMEMYNRVQE